MRVLVTGGSGVLGRALLPRLAGGGHSVAAPSRSELDLFDPDGVHTAMEQVDAVFHLATRIPPPERLREREAWALNDRLRAEATRVLVDAALAGPCERLVFPSVALVYGGGPGDEEAELGDVPDILRSAAEAEQQVRRFADGGHVGVVLRLGLLFGPGTGLDEPAGDSLHIDDAGTALAAALEAPTGIYNVVSDGASIPNARFAQATGWAPSRP